MVFWLLTWRAYRSAKLSVPSVTSRYFHAKLSPTKPGKLSIKTMSNIEIKPAKFSEDFIHCEAEVDIASSTLSPSVLSAIKRRLNVVLDDISFNNSVSVNFKDELDGEKLLLKIKIPHHYAVEIETEGHSSILLSSLDTDSINLRLKDGNCELMNVKSLECNIVAKDTNVVLAKSFVGNINASIENASVLGDKIQGQNINLRTSSGNINISSLYAHKACLQCNHGNIVIGNCHGNAQVSTHRGNVDIKSVDGNIQVTCVEGNVNLNLTDYQSSQVEAFSGSTSVTVPENSRSLVYIKTDDLDVDDDLVLDITDRDPSSNVVEGSLGDCTSETTTDRSLRICAPSVKLNKMDWLTAQKLNFETD